MPREPVKTVEAATSTFHFKRFSVQHRDTAMKVGVDGILLGAWADVRHCHTIVDIGTGTGLLALMLAQRTEPGDCEGATTSIDAIELDAAAAREAMLNVKRSAWAERIRVWQGAIQDFRPCSSYDLAVCNPPFFATGEPSPNVGRARARHEGSLDLETLCGCATKLLRPSGRLSLILPAHRLIDAQQVAREHGLHCRRLLRVRALPHKPVHRVLLEFGLRDTGLVAAEITLESRRHCYTDAFRDLTRDFYQAF